VTPNLLPQDASFDFKPFRLLLKDGSEIHVLSADDCGFDRQTRLLFTGISRGLKAADVERVELLPYRVIDEDREDIARARKALAEIERRGLIPRDEVKRLLGLDGPKGGGK
jgi:hypothetical protein